MFTFTRDSFESYDIECRWQWKLLSFREPNTCPTRCGQWPIFDTFRTLTHRMRIKKKRLCRSERRRGKASDITQRRH